jgi:REP element-mobilizing transposase RayT
MTAYPPLVPGGYFHVYNRGVNGRSLFTEARNYPYFLELYASYLEPVVETFAYCLLNNHFHFLLRVRTEAEQAAWAQQYEKPKATFVSKRASRQFNNFFIAYARAFNNANQRTGPLFESPFHRKPVEDDRYFTNLIAYIHHNPHKHGLMDDFRDWPYSSYRAMLSTKPTKVQRAAVLDWFDGRTRFEAYHRQPVDEAPIAAWIADDWID